MVGNLHGLDPKQNDLLIFYLLFNTLFSSIIATSTIATLGSIADAEFFLHEAHAGVSQFAEALARILLDLLFLLPLTALFTFPLYGLTLMHLGLANTIILYLLCMWAFSPLGYVFSLISPHNATVFTSSFTLVVCAFLNGFFGVTVSMVGPWIKWSPGFATYLLLSWGNAVGRPFTPERVFITAKMSDVRMIPKDAEVEPGLPYEPTLTLTLTEGCSFRRAFFRTSSATPPGTKMPSGASWAGA